MSEVASATKGVFVHPCFGPMIQSYDGAALRARESWQESKTVIISLLQFSRALRTKKHYGKQVVRTYKLKITTFRAADNNSIAPSFQVPGENRARARREALCLDLFLFFQSGTMHIACVHRINTGGEHGRASAPPTCLALMYGDARRRTGASERSRGRTRERIWICQKLDRTSSQEYCLCIECIHNTGDREIAGCLAQVHRAQLGICLLLLLMICVTILTYRLQPVILPRGQLTQMNAEARPGNRDLARALGSIYLNCHPGDMKS